MRAAADCCFQRWCLQPNRPQLAIEPSLLPAQGRCVTLAAEMPVVTQRQVRLLSAALSPSPRVAGRASVKGQGPRCHAQAGREGGGCYRCLASERQPAIEGPDVCFLQERHVALPCGVSVCMAAPSCIAPACSHNPPAVRGGNS
jgi:hypothetical protein